MKVVIVGGVAGGASCAARLRRLDENAEIILLERGEHISFANCGLPYYIGGVIKDKEKLIVAEPDDFRIRFNVDVRTLSEAVAIDRARKTVTIKDIPSGKIYIESYDKLVLAPGAKPVVPDIEGSGSNRAFTLRNIPDTYRIKEFIENTNPKKAVVAGGGFIGIEIAENLAGLGIEVTLAELQEQLLPLLDYDMAAAVHNHIRSKGVNLLLNTAIERIAPSRNGLEVNLGGKGYPADFVVLALGVRAESGLAKDCGLMCSQRGGIKVNKHLQTSDPDIYAAGDAIEVTDFVTGEPVMVPLAGPANKQGRIIADNICGIPSMYGGAHKRKDGKKAQLKLRKGLYLFGKPRHILPRRDKHFDKNHIR
jgi:NADPH-dependent 2,4-dienoyl-CoA reductase/sulfur reductase-like enzyme